MGTNLHQNAQRFSRVGDEDWPLQLNNTTNQWQKPLTVMLLGMDASHSKTGWEERSCGESLHRCQ